MPSRPTRKQIAEADIYQLRRQAIFRRAADVITEAFAVVPEVRAIKLFGSVARPLWREVPRFSEFRRFDIEILHECKDVDLAVWIDRFDKLGNLNRARSLALNREPPIGVAHHQVDVFLFRAGWNNYAGRLCTYGQCPKGKIDCLVPGCGAEAFLRQHEDFTLDADALAGDRSVLLYERGRGIVRRAADMQQADADAR